MMTIFLASLAGIPPLAGLVRQVRDVPLDRRRRAPGGRSSLAVIAAVNSVIAFFYYFARRSAQMWFDEPADRRPLARSVSRRRSAARSRSPSRSTVVVGIYPQLFARVGELAF